jgi:hypothetical protein
MTQRMTRCRIERPLEMLASEVVTFSLALWYMGGAAERNL